MDVTRLLDKIIKDKLKQKPPVVIDYDFIEETKDGIMTTKKVLYKGNGVVQVFEEKQTVVVDEIKAIDDKIAELQKQKEDLSKLSITK